MEQSLLESVRALILLLLAGYLHRQLHASPHPLLAEGWRPMRAGALLVLLGSVIDVLDGGAAGWPPALWLAEHALGYVGGVVLFGYGIVRLVAGGRRLASSEAAASEAAQAVRRDLGLSEAAAARRIAELETALAAAQEARRRAELDCGAKSAFLARMSHELRTPLTTIVGFSDVVQSELFGPLGSPRYRDYVQGIVRASRILTARLADVLDLCDIEAGEIVLHEDVVQPRDLIAACLQLFAERALQRGCTLDFHVDDAMPALRVDARRLKQMLVHLLDHAVGRLGEGGHVTVTASRQGGGVAISVADDAAPPGDGEGADLGMVLTGSLAELFGGRLALRASEAGGLAAVIELPAERIAPAEAAR